MNTQVTCLKAKKGQQGNVLFLILIAVALFAALSYAVTQSTRSGGGDASSEKSLVSSAALTQYPAALKTAIVRMTISNGVDVNFLNFDSPSNFSLLTDGAANTMKSNAVFHPTGGGATYTKPSSDVTTTTVDWTFNANNEVALIGTSSGTSSATAPTADFIAFVPNMKKPVCDKIHSQLGMGAVATTPAFSSLNLTNMATSTINATTGGILATTGVKITGTVFDGQPQGCVYKDATQGYVYYHVLLER